MGRFSIGFAPLTNITKYDVQISGGETRQDYKDTRRFAPSWTVCTNPPFSPTAAPYPVTIILSPTRKDTTKRHWQQPLVTDLEELVLKLCAC